MRPHLRYLKYVLLHKLYVALGGIALGRTMGTIYERPWWYWLQLCWRLLIHDASKFRPSEWRPYVASFYGESEPEMKKFTAAYRDDLREGEYIPEPLTREYQRVRAADAAHKADVRRAFDAAWLKHQHRNDHHWQHWVLREDSGKTKILLPPAIVVDEMLADWLGAGAKILRWPTVAECVGETIVWYCANRTQMQFRQQAQQRIEETLVALASRYGLADMAAEIASAQRARVSVQVAL